MSFDSELLRGSLDLMVLSVLAEKPLYGYLIQQRLREATGERVSLSASTLYPLLHRLEADKHVKATWDDVTGRKRKWYALTPVGRKVLNQRAVQWRDYVDCLKRVLGPVLESAPRLASDAG
jgi:PadR family transcriptional regulator PadR